MIIPLFAKAQEYSYVHYTPIDGLVQTQIMSFFQDTNGFIWLGTKGGISRFDGLNFKNFTINEGLPSNYIYSIFENQSGNIIAITQSGFSYIVNKKVINFFCNIKGFSYNRIVKVKETKKDEWEIVYFSDSSFHIINFKNGIFKKEEIKNKTIEKFKFKDFFRFDFSRIYNQDDYFLFSIDNELYKLENDNITKIIKTNSDIKHIIKGLNQEIYILINDSLFNLKNNKLLYFNKLELKDDNRIASIKIDKKGKLYYIDDNNHFHIDQHTDYYEQSFTNNCNIDRDNIIWLWGEEGLFKIQSQLFTNFIPEKCNINSNIWCISEDKNNYIYFGSFEGKLSRFKNNTFEDINLKKKLNPYPDNLHFYMGSTNDKFGNIYFSLSKLYKFDGTNFEKIKIKNEEKYYSSLFNYIDTIDNKLMAGTNHGLLIKENNKDGKIYKIYPGNKNGRNIACIVKDKLNRYWLGGFKNISILDGKKIIHLPNKDMNFKYGGNAMHVDFKGNIWIGNEKGLFVYDYKKFRKVENPYFNSITGFISEIDKTHLLIGNMNNLGILYLNNYYITEKPFFKIYNKYNGFWGSECVQNGIYKDSENNFWIPAADRVVKFTPATHSVNFKQLYIKIDEISILDKKTLKTTKTTNYLDNAKINLDYYQNNIRIDYLAINTTSPERIKFKYYMDGYDSDWSDETSQRFVIYNNIQPGDYTFYLTVKNEDDMWVSLPKSIKINITKPYWQTTWFQLIVAIFFLSFSSFITYLYIANRRKKQLEKIKNDKKITELQLNSLKGQMDPHFTFNIINTIVSIIYKGQKEEAIKGFTKFSNLLRNVITSPETSYRTIEQEIDFVSNYLELEKFRFKEKFDFIIEIDSNINQYLFVPKMLIQTHTENAIKHGIMHLKNKTGKLLISIKSDVNDIIIVIEDNGIGRTMANNLSKTSTGLGIKIINSYITLFNKYNKEKIQQLIKDLYDEDSNPAGTLVTIKIPKNFNFSI